MFRAGVILGVVVDVIFAAVLVLAFGWVIDSWADKRVPYTGPIVTSAWTIALLFAAGAPILAFGLRRRGAQPGQIMVTLWLPAMLLVTIGVVGLAVMRP